MKKEKRPKRQLPDLSKTDILKPLSISDIGTNGDPCFGKSYDLSTKECKLCGDSELCAIVFAQNLNKTRDDIEKENHFKDMDVLYDLEAIKKFIRTKKRSGMVKKEILDAVQQKFEISREDAREIYKSIKPKTK